MPKFFVPNADPEQAEELWQAVKTSVERGWTRLTDARIFRLGYLHDGKHMEAEVGLRHPYGFPVSWEEENVGDPPEDLLEEVIVIFERDGGPYLVCTLSRGVATDGPILVGTGDAYEVIYFDGYAPST